MAIGFRMVVLSLCGVGAAFADTTVQWVNGETTLGGGIVTVGYDADGQATNLHARTSGGVVTLAGTEAIPFAADAELWVDKGSLRVEAPVVGADAELDLGSLDLGEGAQLNVTMPRTSRLRVGTTRCLTLAQRRAVRVNGEAVHQRDDGYVCEGPSGIVIFIR